MFLCEQSSAWKKRGPGVLDGVQRYGLIGCTGRSARKPTGWPAVPTGRAGAADRGRPFRPGEKGRAARRDARLTLWPPAGGTASREIASDLAFSETRSSRHLSDDSSCGVRGGSGAGRQGHLSCGFPCFARAGPVASLWIGEHGLSEAALGGPGSPSSVTSPVRSQPDSSHGPQSPVGDGGWTCRERHSGDLQTFTAVRDGFGYTDRIRLRDIADVIGPFASPADTKAEAERAMRCRRLAALPVVDGQGNAPGVLALTR